MSRQSTILVTIDFPEIGCSVANIEVTPLGNSTYRLEEPVPLSECTTIYDVIKAKRIDDKTIRFIRVAEHSNWKTYSYCIQKQYVDSAELDAVLAQIETNGARWEQVFGGLLFVYVPPNSEYNPDADVTAMVN